MGHTHSSGGIPAKSTGRLSQDEALGLLTSFQLHQMDHGHKRHRSKLGFVSGITVAEFLDHFPRIFEPFIAILLLEMRRSYKQKPKTGGKITSDHLIQIGSIFRYPKPHELESLIIRGLTKQQEFQSDKDIESSILFEFLTFSYLLSLYLQFPKSPLFFTEKSDKPISTSVPDSDVPQFPKFVSESRIGHSPNHEAIGRADSWDLVQVFQTVGAPHPRSISFTSLGASFTSFRIKRLNDSFVNVMCDWVDTYLTFLPFTISLGLKSLLTPNDNKVTFARRDSLYPPLQNDDDFDDGLPKHSESMIEQQKLTGGWKGFFLSASSRCFDDELCFAIRQSNPEFHANRWTRLYASWLHGRSFNRLVSRILNYPAISLVVIKTEEGQVFGVCVGSPWQESNGRYFGTVDTFLWTFKPHFSWLRASGSGTNLIYLNTKNTFYPKGIGFGGQTSCFRLWLDDEFRNCYCTASDNTYVPGPLCLPLAEISSNNSPSESFQTRFNVQEVEVWGTGDAESLKQLSDAQQRDENIRMERRQVDRSRFAESDFDKEYLLGGKFNHGKIDR